MKFTSNFLYCNHQVHRDFLITLYIFVVFLKNIYIRRDLNMYDYNTRKNVFFLLLALIRAV